MMKQRAQEAFESNDLDPSAILQGVIDNIDAIVFSVDRQYCYTSFNQAHAATMKALYGAEIEIGRSLLSYITDREDRRQAKRNLDRALSGEAFIDSEYSGEGSLSRGYFKVTHNPIKAADGEVIGVAVLAVDMTRSKEVEGALEESEFRYRHLVESIPVGIYRTTPDGRILDVNPALVQMLGYPDRETLLETNTGQKYQVVGDRQRWQAEIEKTGVLRGFETCWLRFDGTPIWIRENARIIRDDQGKVLYYEGAVEDITDHKRAEQQIIKNAAHAEVRARLTSLLIGQHELEIVLKTVCRETIRALHVPASCVYLRDKRLPFFRFAIGSGIPQEDQERLPIIPCNLVESLDQDQGVIIIPDITKVPGAPGTDILSELGCRTLLIAPLILDEQWIGLLAISTVGDVKTFNREELDLFGALASQAIQAIGTAQVIEAANERAAKLALLYDAGLALNSLLKPRDQLQFLFKVALETLQTDRAEFYRFDPKQKTVTFELGVGYTPEILHKMRRVTHSMDDEWPVAWVIQNQVPTNISDVSQNDHTKHLDPSVRSGLWVPVERHRQTKGVLGIFSTSLNAFTKEDERLLLLFANLAAVAMENSSLIAETRFRVHQLNILHEIDVAAAGIFDLEAILEIIVKQATRKLGIDAATILLLDPSSSNLEYAAGAGFYTDTLQHTSLPLGEGYAGIAGLERKIITIPDLRNRHTDHLRSPKFTSEGFVTYYAFPLVCKGQLKGVLEIFFRSLQEKERSWLDFISSLANQAAITIDRAGLFTGLQKANSEIRRTFTEMLEVWARAMDLRDPESSGHTQRVADMATVLAHHMGIKVEDLEPIYQGALLHDIGLIGVPDAILQKPGPLSAEEQEKIREHPLLAYELLHSTDIVRQALDIPYCHHEKWDGSGYPRGLKYELIPFPARIFSIVDVWDSLTSDRPYRKAWTYDQAIAYIRQQAGISFDPAIAEVFLRLINSEKGGLLLSW